jgi:hypothetical protein
MSAAAGDSSGAKSSGAAGDASGDPSAAGTVAMKPKNPNAIPACEAKNNEGACDGSKLYYCIDEAPDGASQTCMSAALCQAGIKSGKCGVCEPGTFQCKTTELQKCDETGQWQLQDTCASEDLCKVSKGICDLQVCTAGEYHCNSTTDELQICNDALTAFMTKEPCDKGLCNEAGKKCNECDPKVPKLCESTSQLTTCTTDGIKKTDPCPTATSHCVSDKNDCFECVTDKDCSESKNECGTRACKDNKCADGDPKPLRTPCGSGNICDLTGTCVPCVTDDDCKDPQKACITAIACVSKTPLTAVADLTGGYLVTIAAGYDATVSAGGSPSGLQKGSATSDTPLLIRAAGSSFGCLSLLAGPSLSLSFGASASDGSSLCGAPMTTVTVTSSRTR